MNTLDIKKELHKLRITQRQMSVDLNIHPATLNHLINGWAKMTDNQRFVFEEYFKIKRKKLLKSLIEEETL